MAGEFDGNELGDDCALEAHCLKQIVVLTNIDLLGETTAIHCAPCPA